MEYPSGGPISVRTEMGERTARGLRAPGPQGIFRVALTRKAKRARGEVTRGDLRGPALCGGSGEQRVRPARGFPKGHSLLVVAGLGFQREGGIRNTPSLWLFFAYFLSTQKVGPRRAALPHSRPGGDAQAGYLPNKKADTPYSVPAFFVCCVPYRSSSMKRMIMVAASARVALPTGRRVPSS